MAKKAEIEQQLGDLQAALSDLYYRHIDGMSAEKYLENIKILTEKECAIDPGNLPSGCPLCSRLASHPHYFD